MFETENRTPPTLDGMKSELERRKATKNLMDDFFGGLLDVMIEHEADPAKKANMTILRSTLTCSTWRILRLLFLSTP